MTNIYFNEVEDDHLPYQYTDFVVGEVSYTIIFSYPIESSFDFDEEIKSLLQNKETYTIKFLQSDIFYHSDYEGGIYDAPNVPFNKTKLKALRYQLENIFLAHYQQYQPECYIFVAEKPSLARMYQKMCEQRSENLLQFRALTALGKDRDCFVIYPNNHQEE